MKNILTILILSLITITSFSQVINQRGNGTSGFQINPLGGLTPFTPNNPNGPTGQPSPPGDGDRQVFWLHGLSGNHHAWSKAADASQHGGAPNFAPQGYKINSNTTGLTYSEKSTTLLAAQDVRNYIERVATTQRQLGVDPKKNFIVAHSQGGVVSQAVLYKEYCFDPNLNGPSFGGIVTFGSPHKGAMILNNAEKLKDWLKSGCNDLSDGPAEEFKNGFIGKLLDLFVDDAKLPYKGANKDTLCSKVVEKVTNLLDLLKPITNDYKVQGIEGPLHTYKQCIEANAGEMNKVAFFGVEPVKDLPWRTLDWMMVRDVNADAAKFEANDDTKLADSLKRMRVKYVQKVAEKEKEIFELKFLYGMPCNWYKWIIMPITCGLYDYKYYDAIDEKAKYEKGIAWFDKADDNWNDVIGALTMTTRTRHYCECITKPGNKETISEVNDPSECKSSPGKICSLNSITEYVKSYKPSDGIVLAESASEFPGASSLPVGGADRELKNSSHMQMRNDHNLRTKLTLLMDDAKYGDFFKTPRR
jgi:hypothetical protein